MYSISAVCQKYCIITNAAGKTNKHYSRKTYKQSRHCCHRYVCNVYLTSGRFFKNHQSTLLYPMTVYIARRFSTHTMVSARLKIQKYLLKRIVQRMHAPFNTASEVHTKHSHDNRSMEVVFIWNIIS